MKHTGQESLMDDIARPEIQPDHAIYPGLFHRGKSERRAFVQPEHRHQPWKNRAALRLALFKQIREFSDRAAGGQTGPPAQRVAAASSTAEQAAGETVFPAEGAAGGDIGIPEPSAPIQAEHQPFLGSQDPHRTAIDLAGQASP